MKKWMSSLAVALMVGAVATACSSTSEDNSKTTVTEETSVKQTIQVTVDKHYEDGVDLKATLQDAKTAKGKWVVKYCGLEHTSDSTSTSVVAGFGYSECDVVPDGQEYDHTVYASFTGEVDGKQTKVDKVYPLTKEEIDKVPLER
jgi:hypothetical protein